MTTGLSATGLSATLPMFGGSPLHLQLSWARAVLLFLLATFAIALGFIPASRFDRSSIANCRKGIALRSSSCSAASVTSLPSPESRIQPYNSVKPSANQGSMPASRRLNV